MINLQQFRSKAKALPDLLNIALIADEVQLADGGVMGIAVTKSGSLVAAFTFAGPDIESSSEAELEALSGHLNHAIARLGTGWAAHLDTVRQPAAGYTDSALCSFPDPVTALIDDERRAQYTSEQAGDTKHYLTHQVATFSCALPTDAENNFEKLLVTNRQSAEVKLSEYIARFKSDMETIMSIFAGVASVRVLNSRGLLTHIHGCLTDDWHPVNPPHLPVYLDAVLGAHDFIGGFAPKIDDQYIAVVGIAGFPPDTTPVALESLNTLAIPFRFSLRFLFLDPATAQDQLSKYRRNWWQKRHGLATQVSMAMGGGGSAFENTDAVMMAADADAAIAEASSGVVRYGFFTAVVVLHSDSAAVLKDRVKVVRKHLDNLGFVTREETINAVEAYLGSIPGHTFENVRRPLLSSLSLVDMAPTTSIWAGSKTSPNPLYKPFYNGKPAPCLLHAATTGNTPFALNLHVGDLGHTLVVGPTGSGKSVLLALIAAQFRRYPRARVFSFDKGWSMYALAKATSGDHYDIGGEETLSFAPLSRVHESAAERAFGEEFVETLCVLQGITIDAAKRALIHDAVGQLAETPVRGINNLVHLVQDDDLRAALGFYASTGRAGSLLAASTDTLDLAHARFSVFELERLLTGGEQAKLVVVPTLMYLFHRIEAALTAGDPALIILDEAWVMLDNPIFSAKIREWLKVQRKFNTAVIFATQSLADLQNSPLRPVLQESCPTKILLPNREAASEQLAPLYQDLGLNQHQIKLLQASTPKSDYYIVSPDGRRRISLAIGPVAMAFVGVSSRKDIEALNACMEQNGRRWQIEWLRSRLPRMRQDWVPVAEQWFEHYGT